MTTVTRHLLFGLATLAIAGTALAGPQKKSSSPSTQPGAVRPAKSAAAAPSKPAAPTTLAASGKIVRFDADAQSLTLSTSKGEEQFKLEASTRLRSASHAISPSELSALTGRQATVRYHETSGQKTVLSVRVSPASKASAKH